MKFPYFIFIWMIYMPCELLAQAPRILSTAPSQNELNVAISTNVAVVFDADMDEATINSSTFVVNGRSTGLVAGSYSYDEVTSTATFDPSQDLMEGDLLTVVLTTGTQSLDGFPLADAYIWPFTMDVAGGTASFADHADYDAGEGTWSIVSADLDDGDLDLIASSCYSQDISILMNNGDGTFASQSNYTVGEAPTSVAAVDLDGDGDIDPATANHGTDNVSVLVNRSGCEYLAGDCNHNGTPLELADVVAMIGMYRRTSEPGYFCDCPPHGGEFPPQADPNGNCVPLELGDVVTEIGACRGTAQASSCADCPEQPGILPDGDGKSGDTHRLNLLIMKDRGQALE